MNESGSRVVDARIQIDMVLQQELVIFLDRRLVGHRFFVVCHATKFASGLPSHQPPAQCPAVAQVAVA